MEPLSYVEHLKQSGLEADQAKVYEALMERGPSPASLAARRAGISRTLTYKVLGELEGLGLVSKKEDAGKVAIFTAAHPLKLKELIEKREANAKDSLRALEGVMGAMTSAYNLAGGKPGVQFREGKEGVEEALNDTLSAREEIYAYMDTESIEKYVSEINAAYVIKRKRKGISKKILMVDSPLARTKAGHAADGLTEIRLISATEKGGFSSVLEIYSGKVAYITFANSSLTSTIVHDEEIYKLHRYLFEALWEKAEPR